MTNCDCFNFQLTIISSVLVISHVNSFHCVSDRSFAVISAQYDLVCVENIIKS